MTRTLFGEEPNPEKAKKAKRRAIKRVGANAGPWLEMAVKRIGEFCALKESFTADDLWKILPNVPERRALGAAMTVAGKRGFCYPTETYIPSKRAKCHARPIRVWRSKAHGL